ASESFSKPPRTRVMRERVLRNVDLADDAGGFSGTGSGSILGLYSDHIAGGVLPDRACRGRATSGCAGLRHDAAAARLGRPGRSRLVSADTHLFREIAGAENRVSQSYPKTQNISSL